MKALVLLTFIILGTSGIDYEANRRFTNGHGGYQFFHAEKKHLERKHQQKHNPIITSSKPTTQLDVDNDIAENINKISLTKSDASKNNAESTKRNDNQLRRIGGSTQEHVMDNETTELEKKGVDIENEAKTSTQRTKPRIRIKKPRRRRPSAEEDNAQNTFSKRTSASLENSSEKGARRSSNSNEDSENSTDKVPLQNSFKRRILARNERKQDSESNSDKGLSQNSSKRRISVRRSSNSNETTDSENSSDKLLLQNSLKRRISARRNSNGNETTVDSENNSDTAPLQNTYKRRISAENSSDTAPLQNTFKRRISVRKSSNSNETNDTEKARLQNTFKRRISTRRSSDSNEAKDKLINEENESHPPRRNRTAQRGRNGEESNSKQSVEEVVKQISVTVTNTTNAISTNVTNTQRRRKYHQRQRNRNQGVRNSVERSKLNSVNEENVDKEVMLLSYLLSLNKNPPTAKIQQNKDDGHKISWNQNPENNIKSKSNINTKEDLTGGKVGVKPRTDNKVLEAIIKEPNTADKILNKNEVYEDSSVKTMTAKALDAHQVMHEATTFKPSLNKMMDKDRIVEAFSRQIFPKPNTHKPINHDGFVEIPLVHTANKISDDDQDVEETVLYQSPSNIEENDKHEKGKHLSKIEENDKHEKGKNPTNIEKNDKREMERKQSIEVSKVASKSSEDKIGREDSEHVQLHLKEISQKIRSGESIHTKGRIGTLNSGLKIVDVVKSETQLDKKFGKGTEDENRKIDVLSKTLEENKPVKEFTSTISSDKVKNKIESEDQNRKDDEDKEVNVMLGNENEDTIVFSKNKENQKIIVMLNNTKENKDGNNVKVGNKNPDSSKVVREETDNKQLEIREEGNKNEEGPKEIQKVEAANKNEDATKVSQMEEAANKNEEGIKGIRKKEEVIIRAVNKNEEGTKGIPKENETIRAANKNEEGTKGIGREEEILRAGSKNEKGNNGIRKEEEIMQATNKNEEEWKGIRKQEEIIRAENTNEEGTKGIGREEEIIQAANKNKEGNNGIRKEEEIMQAANKNEEGKKGIRKEEEIIRGANKNEERTKGIGMKEEIIRAANKNEEGNKEIQKEEEIMQAANINEKGRKGIRKEEEIIRAVNKNEDGMKQKQIKEGNTQNVTTSSKESLKRKNVTVVKKRRGSHESSQSTIANVEDTSDAKQVNTDEAHKSVDKDLKTKASNREEALNATEIKKEERHNLNRRNEEVRNKIIKRRFKPNIRNQQRKPSEEKDNKNVGIENTMSLKSTMQELASVIKNTASEIKEVLNSNNGARKKLPSSSRERLTTNLNAKANDKILAKSSTENKDDIKVNIPKMLRTRSKAIDKTLGNVEAENKEDIIANIPKMLRARLRTTHKDEDHETNLRRTSANTSSIEERKIKSTENEEDQNISNRRRFAEFRRKNWQNHGLNYRRRFTKREKENLETLESSNVPNVLRKRSYIEEPKDNFGANGYLRSSNSEEIKGTNEETGHLSSSKDSLDKKNETVVKKRRGWHESRNEENSQGTIANNEDTSDKKQVNIDEEIKETNKEKFDSKGHLTSSNSEEIKETNKEKFDSNGDLTSSNLEEIKGTNKEKFYSNGHLTSSNSKEIKETNKEKFDSNKHLTSSNSEEIKETNKAKYDSHEHLISSNSDGIKETNKFIEKNDKNLRKEFAQNGKGELKLQERNIEEITRAKNIELKDDKREEQTIPEKERMNKQEIYAENINPKREEVIEIQEDNNYPKTNFKEESDRVKLEEEINIENINEKTNLKLENEASLQKQSTENGVTNTRSKEDKTYLEEDTNKKKTNLKLQSASNINLEEETNKEKTNLKLQNASLPRQNTNILIEKNNQSPYEETKQQEETKVVNVDAKKGINIEMSQKPHKEIENNKKSISDETKSFLLNDTKNDTTINLESKEIDTLVAAESQKMEIAKRKSLNFEEKSLTFEGTSKEKSLNFEERSEEEPLNFEETSKEKPLNFEESSKGNPLSFEQRSEEKPLNFEGTSKEKSLNFEETSLNSVNIKSEANSRIDQSTEASVRLRITSGRPMEINPHNLHQDEAPRASTLSSGRPANINPHNFNTQEAESAQKRPTRTLTVYTRDIYKLNSPNFEDSASKNKILLKSNPYRSESQINKGIGVRQTFGDNEESASLKQVESVTLKPRRTLTVYTRPPPIKIEEFGEPNSLEKPVPTEAIRTESTKGGLYNYEEKAPTRVYTRPLLNKISVANPSPTEEIKTESTNGGQNNYEEKVPTRVYTRPLLNKIGVPNSLRTLSPTVEIKTESTKHGQNGYETKLPAIVYTKPPLNKIEDPLPTEQIKTESTKGDQYNYEEMASTRIYTRPPLFKFEDPNPSPTEDIKTIKVGPNDNEEKVPTIVYTRPPLNKIEEPSSTPKAGQNNFDPKPLENTTEQFSTTNEEEDKNKQTQHSKILLPIPYRHKKCEETLEDSKCKKPLHFPNLFANRRIPVIDFNKTLSPLVINNEFEEAFNKEKNSSNVKKSNLFTRRVTNGKIVTVFTKTTELPDSRTTTELPNSRASTELPNIRSTLFTTKTTELPNIRTTLSSINEESKKNDTVVAEKNNAKQNHVSFKPQHGKYNLSTEESKHFGDSRVENSEDLKQNPQHGKQNITTEEDKNIGDSQNNIKDSIAENSEITNKISVKKHPYRRNFAERRRTPNLKNDQIYSSSNTKRIQFSNNNPIFKRRGDVQISQIINKPKTNEEIRRNLYVPRVNPNLMKMRQKIKVNEDAITPEKQHENADNNNLVKRKTDVHNASNSIHLLKVRRPILKNALKLKTNVGSQIINKTNNSEDNVVVKDKEEFVLVKDNEGNNVADAKYNSNGNKNGETNTVVKGKEEIVLVKDNKEKNVAGEKYNSNGNKNGEIFTKNENLKKNDEKSGELFKSVLNIAGEKYNSNGNKNGEIITKNEDLNKNGELFKSVLIINGDRVEETTKHILIINNDLAKKNKTYYFWLKPMDPQHIEEMKHKEGSYNKKEINRQDEEAGEYYLNGDEDRSPQKHSNSEYEETQSTKHNSILHQRPHIETTTKTESNQRILYDSPLRNQNFILKMKKMSVKNITTTVSPLTSMKLKRELYTRKPVLKKVIVTSSTLVPYFERFFNSTKLFQQINAQTTTPRTFKDALKNQERSELPFLQKFRRHT